MRDGADHSAKANRCIVQDLGCVGYYVILSDYDAETDTFGVGWKRRVPAAQVDEVAVFDITAKALEAVDNFKPG